MRIHPITGLPLEDGFGALSDDLQARRIHIPYIRQWQGDAAADVVLAKLDAADAPPPAPEPATATSDAQKPAEVEPAVTPAPAVAAPAELPKVDPPAAPTLTVVPPSAAPEPANAIPSK